VSKKDVKVKWMLNGERLVANDNVKLIAEDENRILKIKNCQLSDSGPLTCILPGDVSISANLKVEGQCLNFFKKSHKTL
jgi:hypothetical protein